MSQVKALAEQVITAVKAYVAQSVAGVATRLDQFETQIRAIPAPLKGEPGKDADPAIVESLVAEHVSKAVEAIPKPVNGKDADPDLIASLVSKAINALPLPINGKDADPALIAEQVTKAVEALPKPTDGKPGLNAFEVAVSLGFDGTVHDWMKSLDGKPGSSVTLEQVLPVLQVEMQKAVAAIPPPKDGDPGKGVTVDDFRTMFEAESLKALLDFERRAQDVLLKAISNIPAPKDGADGLGFDDLEVIHDGERQITLKFVRGDVVKEFPLIVPALIDRGVYRSGQAYEKGDCVSYGGSIWIAQKDTESKPEIDDSWRLSVKRGRDGKDAIGLKGDKGDRGDDGKDLTQIGHDGSKW